MVMDNTAAIEEALEHLEREVGEAKTKIDEKRREIAELVAETDKMKAEMDAKDKESKQKKAEVLHLDQEVNSMRLMVTKNLARVSHLKVEEGVLERGFQASQQKIAQSHMQMERAHRDAAFQHKRT
jgi:chromosome segregation ATPase